MVMDICAVEQPCRVLGCEALAHLLWARPGEGHEVERVARDNLVEVCALHNLTELLVRFVQSGFGVEARLALVLLDDSGTSDFRHLLTSYSLSFS